MIQVRNTIFTTATQYQEVSAETNFEGIPILVIRWEGGHAEFIAQSAESAQAAAEQVNQLIAEGTGGSTEITIIDDF